MLASESNEWLMSRLAMNEMVFGKIIPFEKVMTEVESIEIDDIYQITDEIFKNEEFAIAVIGPEDIGKRMRDFKFDF